MDASTMRTAPGGLLARPPLPPRDGEVGREVKSDQLIRLLMRLREDAG